ncbi:SMI1/KNR4 family protein [Stigmatella hybrida]|uniref:SMI1/KNR4 family protein n=1 Tax=Stigmatella hybrida TaxID=394097 RepID=UPI001CDB3F45|nr:SMI1/KNR4 family protein [Stigmatella hybrida]
MTDLLDEISREHFPYPPASPEEIDTFEQRVGWKLDPDLRTFYLHCNGAELIERLPDTPYRILPLTKIIRARVSIYGEDDDKWGPASTYALCDVQDGNYVMVDVARQENGRYPLFDGDHEAWPDPAYCKQITHSFAKFLEQILRTRRGLYWLGIASAK